MEESQSNSTSETSHPVDEPAPDWPTVQQLARKAGLGSPLRLERLAGGRNNRVYRLQDGAQSVLLKWYFQHPGDRRDRLNAEFRFAEFAWRRGIGELPQPLARDVPSRIALYEFIPGRKIATEEVSGPQVQAAARFVRRINRYADQPEAAALPTASEACFSIQEHLQLVGRRVAALETLPPAAPILHQARQLVGDVLRPRGERVSAWVTEQCLAHRLVPEEQLPQAQRCLSPSDFGFHNALMTPAGTVRFIDFEYAGWDDPAKLICDFFCQVQRPVPREHFTEFTTTAFAEGGAEPSGLLLRSKILLPVYRLKWCCIVLNDFLPAGEARRRFSLPAASAQRLQQQLDKARAMLAELDPLPDVDSDWKG